VDDEAAVGEFMRELLESWGLEASYAPGPASALELVAADPRRFDVVITDQAMPRMTGLQLATALRQQRPDLPVVLYTGYGEGIAPADLQAAGIRAVIAKPVDPGALHATLSGVLGRDASRPAP
jgi:CheY-like chemotaxis protein